MSPGVEAAPLVCPYAPEHPVITERLAGHDRQLGDHEARLRATEAVIFEARGAWKFAAVLGVVVGGAAGAIVTGVLELVLRGHGG